MLGLWNCLHFLPQNTLCMITLPELGRLKTQNFHADENPREFMLVLDQVCGKCIFSWKLSRSYDSTLIIRGRQEPISASNTSGTLGRVTKPPALLPLPVLLALGTGCLRSRCKLNPIPLFNCYHRQVTKKRKACPLENTGQHPQSLLITHP